MSTPHKLNVTFWDMAEKPNNGYTTKITNEKSKKYKSIITNRRFVLYAGVGSVICLLTCAPMVASAILPFFAVASVHFCHAIINQESISNEMSHGLFCASVLGEIIGGATSPGFASRTAIHLLLLMLTGVLLGQEPTLLMYAGSRLFLWSCLPWVPEVMRAILSYASVLGGVIAAKYIENVFVTKIIAEIKLAAPRRRRTSNNSLYNLYKMRRTSLPALGGSNKSAHHAYGFQVRQTSYLYLRFRNGRFIGILQLFNLIENLL